VGAGRYPSGDHGADRAAISRRWSPPLMCASASPPRGRADGHDPREFSRFVESEIEAAQRIVRVSGIKPQ